MNPELERLRAENERLKSKEARATLTMKASDKGGLSVYGLGRFPVTLHKEQWQKLLSHAADIQAYLAANDAPLKSKESQNRRASASMDVDPRSSPLRTCNTQRPA
jgi:hypothetical protein